MGKFIMIVLVAVAAWFSLNREPEAPAVVTAKPPVVEKVPGAIVIVPIKGGDLKDRWKTGPTAQTNLTEGASWK